VCVCVCVLFMQAESVLYVLQGDSSVRYLELTDKEPFLVESWLYFV